MNWKKLFRKQSNKVLQRIETWRNAGKIQLMERPSWDYIMISMAHKIKERSIDSQTQCGCVITNVDHRVLGVGYNGFPSDIDDTMLPNVRPDKYDFIIHAEKNAILNCEHRPTNGIAYVTIKPCLSCLIFLWQAGIREIVYDLPEAAMTADEETKLKVDIMAWLMSHKLIMRRYKND